MNKIDKDYQALLQDIMDNGASKSDRTGTGTISVFGRQIRHKMSDGFPLLTTKKMYWRGVVVELLWFLRGETNIKYLVDNDVHIWDGDAYKAFCKERLEIHNKIVKENPTCDFQPWEEITQEEFIDKIKTDSEFAKTWGELGPIYGHQWRKWNGIDRDAFFNSDNLEEKDRDARHGLFYKESEIDQIANSVNLLKTDPDSRRNKVSAWNVGELDQMALPPCHTDFQFYTRELSLEDRIKLNGFDNESAILQQLPTNMGYIKKKLDENNIPTRAISLMWNQRSVDTFLGLPFNIASYGLLLEIIAKAVNMVPDELIGNLGDTHLYKNHIDQAKLQISRDLDLEERRAMVSQEMFNQIYSGGSPESLSHSECDQWNIPRIIPREPYLLPKLEINTEFWPTESGECGIGDLTSNMDSLIQNIQIEDFRIVGYQSHPAIKAPLSN